MVSIFTYIYHKNQPNLGKYDIQYHTWILWVCEFDHTSFYHPQKLKLRGVFFGEEKNSSELYQIPNFGGKGCQVSGGLSKSTIKNIMFFNMS